MAKAEKDKKQRKKVPASSKEILARAHAANQETEPNPAKANVKTKFVKGKVRQNTTHSETSGDSEDEDEKPKASQLKASSKKVASSSESSDSDDQKISSKLSKNPAAQSKADTKKSIIAPVPQKNSPSSDESSEEDSDSGSEQPITKPGVTSTSKPPKSSSTGESSDSESSSGEESKSKPAAAKIGSPSSDNSDSDSDSDSDSSSDPDPADSKPITQTVNGNSKDSESSSSDSEPDSKSAAKTATSKQAQLSSSDETDSSDSSSSDSESEDGGSDVEMADSSAKIHSSITNGKRKATEEVPIQTKKVKLDPSTQETKSIFVGRLSWSVDSDRLAQEFASCGEVISATVQTDRNTGKSRGFGYVHFSTTEAVEKALEMSGTEIDGRAIHVDRSSPPDPAQAREKRSKVFGDQISPPSRTLFVGNLPFTMTEDSLWSHFEEYNVKNIRLPTDRETGQPKGFGYIELEDVDGAKKAFETLNGTEIEGRRIRLDYSQPRDGGGGGRGNYGRGRGNYSGDRGSYAGGRGGRGYGGDRGMQTRGRGGRGRGGPQRGTPKSGGIAAFEGRKVTF